jgi:hypothetical protein
MRFDVRQLSKKIIPSLVRRKETGNIITAAGGLLVILSMTLPAFLKIYSESSTYISALEYLYMLASSGIGSAVVAAALCTTAVLGAAALIAGPSIPMSVVAVIALAAGSASMWSLHLPCALFGFGTWCTAAGLIAIAAGRFIRR